MSYKILPDTGSAHKHRQVCACPGTEVLPGKRPPALGWPVGRLGMSTALKSAAFTGIRLFKKANKEIWGFLMI